LFAIAFLKSDQPNSRYKYSEYTCTIVYHTLCMLRFEVLRMNSCDDNTQYESAGSFY